MVAKSVSNMAPHFNLITEHSGARAKSTNAYQGTETYLISALASDGRLDVGYSGLLALRKKSLRNRNWFRLSVEDRGLFRCAMWVARVQGSIVNLKLLVRVLGIVLRMLENASTCIWRIGKTRAEELERAFKEKGLFDWAPQMTDWLRDKHYVIYLGVGGF